MISIACVWTGEKYPFYYVERLKNMVERNLPVQHRFICYTDRPGDIPRGFCEVARAEWPGWWGKISVFNPEIRNSEQTIFFDLDTVILDDISALCSWRGDFAICENFTKLAGNTGWSCNFGSCVMSIGKDFGFDLHQIFKCDPEFYMSMCHKGDQEFIETETKREYVPYLQDLFQNKNYFTGYRDFVPDAPPKGCHIAIFAGNNKPHNYDYQWIKDAWR